jgi:hypothetical protein
MAQIYIKENEVIIYMQTHPSVQNRGVVAPQPPPTPLSPPGGGKPFAHTLLPLI